MVAKSGMKELIIHSDGSSSHFKHKYTLCNMKYLSEILSFLIMVLKKSYHGKGAVDAVGGIAIT